MVAWYYDPIIEKNDSNATKRKKTGGHKLSLSFYVAMYFRIYRSLETFRAIKTMYNLSITKILIQQEQVKPCRR